jgi:hypothetical protein
MKGLIRGFTYDRDLCALVMVILHKRRIVAIAEEVEEAGSVDDFPRG